MNAIEDSLELHPRVGGWKGWLGNRASITPAPDVFDRREPGAVCARETVSPCARRDGRPAQLDLPRKSPTDAAEDPSSQSDTATYTRVPGSELLAGVSYASGVQTTYGYEPTRDLKTQVRNVANGATVSQYDYTYDVIGRRGNVVNSGTAFVQPAFSRWNYNDRNELIESSRYLGTNVADESNPVPEEHRGYGFDPIGNRLAATEAGTSKSYQVNALNEYTTVAGATLVYDADGNLTSDGMRKFMYDAENRLTVVEPATSANGGVRVRMTYDYRGRRVQKLVDEYSGGTWTNQDDVRWVYAGWNKIEERRTSGGVTTKKNFVWGLDLSQSVDGAGGIGGLLAVADEAGSQMAFVYDANGNVGQLVDEQGAVTAKYEYDAFGQTLVAAGAVANDNAYRFSTKYADEETGLVYYGYRYYSAGLGRWVNRDPLDENGGANLHGFVANRPLDRADKDGRICVKAFGHGASRATIKCDSCDSVEDLSSLVAFDKREFAKWLRAEDGKGLPKTVKESFRGARKFSVPNTVYVVKGAPNPDIPLEQYGGDWPTYLFAANTTSALSAAGYRAVFDGHVQESSLRGYFGDPDIYGLVYFGHGAAMYVRHDSRDDLDVEVSPYTARSQVHHGLAALTHYGCFSMSHKGWASGFGWEALVARRGFFSGQTDQVNPWTQIGSATTVKGSYDPTWAPE